MSLKTRCPACDTVFKIVPDQLKVSSGWVRCGRCAEVFDAAAHAVSVNAASQWLQTSAPVAIAASVPLPPEDTTIAIKNVAIQAINTTARVISSSKNQINEPNLSFVRVAKNKAFWQRAVVTRTLSAACIGLAGLLFLQLVYSQRNHLAASSPAFKSGLASVCQMLGCLVEPHKDIDAFKIESSSFQKAPTAAADAAQADVFALKITLKNSADIPLAIPAVELTLTEAGDKPVLRRILSAKDLGFKGATLGANGDWTGEMTVAVTSTPAMPPITGYRVLLFYP